jgi:membrane protein
MCHDDDDDGLDKILRTTVPHLLSCLIKLLGGTPMANPLTVVRDTVYGFVEDEALTRGAAIAFYTTTAIGPLLFLVIAIAGLIYGQDAANGAILSQLGDTMGHDSASLLQSTIQTAAKYTSGFAILGVGILVVTVSGVMSEMQQALNVIWKAVPKQTTITGWLRTRAIGLSLVGPWLSSDRLLGDQYCTLCA